MVGEPKTTRPMQPSFDAAQRLEKQLQSVIHGQPATIRRILACLFSGGHCLLEDVPGTGKTTLAKAIAHSIDGARFQRVQFTPDLLPSDILGVSVFDPTTSVFRFQEGPVFTDMLLADEINRASPRVQSALLEAMAEGQVTIDGMRYHLGELFFVIATQNPIEFRGTYPLPEAQMDRFAMQCQLGYVTEREEVKILQDQRVQHPVDALQPVVTRQELLRVMQDVSDVRVSEELQHYIVRLVSATRQRKDLQLAASPRASLALMKMAQALSLLESREFVVPETIQELAADVIAHRLVLSPEARYAGITGRSLIAEILQQVPVPA
jgi:MoxR-like ATPase